MKHHFLLLVFLALPALAAAQCYTVHRDAGKKLMADKEYDEAIVRFTAAKKCQRDKPANGDKEMNDLIAEAKKLKLTLKPPNPKPPNPKPQPAKKTGPTEAEKEAAAARDDEDWELLQGHLVGCRRYLAKYEKKNGRHVAAARQCVRDLSDDDSDGVPNKDDRCPTEKGTAAYDGCPPPAKPTTQSTPLSPGGGDGGGACAGCPEMVFVAGGRFTMGCQDSRRDGECYSSEQPSHEVTLRDFYIGKYEVTQAEWRRVMGSDPSYNSGCDQCPVEQVSWDDVQTFIKKLNAQTGKKYRLPTEAEWEYAARGGSKTNGYLYSGSNNIADVAWYDQNYKNGNTFGSNKTTRPVGTRVANELGIHDMSGNVYEWCSDWYGAYTSGSQTNPTGPTSGSSRVVRGGSWYFSTRIVRVSVRGYGDPAVRDLNVGFRVAQDK